MIQSNSPDDLAPSAKRKIVRIIKELEALSASTNSAAEAANAAAKAQSLLLKHHLSVSDVEDLEEELEPLVERKEVLDGKRHIAGWKQILLSVVAKACLCEWMTSFASEQGDRTFSFIGRSSNVEIARYTFRVLERQVIELGEKEKLRRRLGGESTRKHMKDYLEGIVDSIRGLLAKEQATVSRSNSEVNALIISKGIEAADYRQKLYPDVSFGTRTTYYNANSRERGQLAGKSVRLKDALSSDGKRRKLLE